MDLWSDFPKTVIEFEERFASEQSCCAYLAKQRWPEGFRCPACGHDKAWQLSRRRLMECRACHRQVSVTAGTIFHRSRKPLRLWFKAMLLMTAQRPGISALSLMRQLGLTSYQTAWTWLHKLRHAMVRPGREALLGQVEVDDGYVGGEETGVHGRETKNKAVVAVAVEVKGQAAGRLRMERVEDASASSLNPFVTHNVVPGSTVRTDGWSGYEGLRQAGYRHRPRVVGDPKRAARLFPHAHRALSLLKRWLLGTHQGAVRPHHLGAYLDEFVFRFNRRSSGRVTLPFQRLCAIAVLTAPVTYRRIVDEAQLLGPA